MAAEIVVRGVNNLRLADVNACMNRRESAVERIIREAMEKGEFDNLPGKGKPIDTSENPFEDPDLRMVHRLLRNAGYAPAWIEERKSIEREFEAARTKLARGASLYRTAPSAPSPSAEANWERVVKDFGEAVTGLK